MCFFNNALAVIFDVIAGVEEFRTRVTRRPELKEAGSLPKGYLVYMVPGELQGPSKIPFTETLLNGVHMGNVALAVHYGGNNKSTDTLHVIYCHNCWEW
jgi:hypothetical protein